ncbi:hypothetical protein [Carboxylicivirga sp. N1Y90]|uniref:hypothetical protein n=1 Tax=Carboxylicivirga fragile TaxID=3417571 RepID=UPI003D348A77|nr:hypothetical protein [Marinilabiliaceae bacterium N1Y90]
MKNNKTVIIHFQPLEYYPPVQNAINEFAPNMALSVFSIHNDSIKNKFVNNRVSIIRPVCLNTQDSKSKRLLKYILFNLITIIKILKLRPKNILYYETESAFPAYFLTKYLGVKSKLFIHYHEYNTPNQYRTGMAYTRYLHKKETYLYKKACWISHTNQYRIDMFLSDLPMINPEKLIQLPNYPPKKWEAVQKKALKKLTYPIKLVYVGSLSTKHMYTQELFEWIRQMEGKFFLDIYAINIRQDALDLINQYGSKYIQYKGGLNYDNIPNKLENYDIGLVIYKDYSPNVKYCASNKVFEYLTCNLDVWYSKEIIGTQQYQTKNSYPKVQAVDYTKLEKLDYQSLINRNGYERKEFNFRAEDVLNRLKKQLTN